MYTYLYELAAGKIQETVGYDGGGGGGGVKGLKNEWQKPIPVSVGYATSFEFILEQFF